MAYRIEARISNFGYTRSSQPILSNFNLSVPTADFVSIMGPSGVGKTTLLRIIAGLELRYSGDVSVNGSSRRHASKDIQLLFQDDRLLPWKTVSENIAFAFDNPTTDSAKHRVRELLDEVGLEKLKNAWVKTLSGGEKTRVALARALAPKPKVLLLDEPMRGLDFLSKLMVSRLLQPVAEADEKTAIMVSHDIEDAVLLSRRILFVAGRPLEIVAELENPLPYPRTHTDDTVREIIKKARAFITG